MLPLALAMQFKGSEGGPIWNPYPGLREINAHIRRGQLSMIVAPPGCGKTAFITDWMLELPKNPYGDSYSVLFFSLDSDRGTVGTRVAASVANMTTDQVEPLVQKNDPNILRRIAEATAHIGYSFYSRPDFDRVRLEIIAFAYVHGKWPDVIVVDNLVDVESDGSGHESQNATAEWLKTVASETGAAVILLHHATGAFATGQTALPISAVLGQVNRPQRLILTLSRPAPDILNVAVVKNSNGPADATGVAVGTLIPIDLSFMRFFKERIIT